MLDESTRFSFPARSRAGVVLCLTGIESGGTRSRDQDGISVARKRGLRSKYVLADVSFSPLCVLRPDKWSKMAKSQKSIL
jgi:hypothetical protein